MATRINIAEDTAPVSNPGTATVDIYAKADGKLYSKDDAGTEYDLTAGAAGGDTHPINDSTAIVQDPADTTKQLRVDVGGNTTAIVGVLAAAFTTAKTVTLPDATDTLVGKATTDTLTNKTIDANGTGNAITNIDVADLANGTDGELITWDAAAAPATVAAGTSGHVLTSNGAGAAPTFQAAAGGGANTALSNLAAVAINLSLTSDTDITDDLGTGDIRWRDGYVSTLRAGLTAADTLLLQARDVDGAAWTTFATLTSNNTPTMDLATSVTRGGNVILDDASTASALTSLGTLTTLTVDNITVNGNTINADTGALNLTPTAGSAIVLDGTINVDAGVVTGATSITSTTFVGALTGNADTVTTNANLTGEVTSTGNAAVLNVTAISNQGLVTAVGADHVVIVDATDGTLKKSLISDFASAGGDMAAATYDPATIAEQLVGLTATQTLTNKKLSDSTVTIVDNADATKQIAFQASGITTSTTRTITMPDADVTLGNIAVNTTHLSSDGSDHSFIDQDVTSGASPTFTGTNFTGVNAATVTFADVAGDTTTFVALATAATGDLAAGTDPGITYNATTNALTAASFVGALTGNADTVTTNANLTGDVTSVGNATTIAAKAVDVAMLADGTDGELITWSATGVAETIAVGTATHVLTSNGIGVAPTFQAPTGGLSNIVEDVTPQLGAQLDVNGFGLGDGTLELLTFTETASAVNHVNLTNAATANAPVISVVGDDANVDLHIQGKGVGNVILQDGTDTTKRISFELTGATTATTMSIVSSQASSNSLTLPDVTDFLVARTSTDLLSNKTFQDSTVTFVDNTDNSKKIAFQASGITTSTTRTITMPDTDVALVDIATNTTHRTSNGSDHSFIDQDVTSGSTPTLTATNITGLPVAGLAAGTDGELITWDASANAATVAAGTSGQVLTSNGAGAAPTFQAAAGGGANTALSNLASVAINLSLTSDTDITDDLGTGDIRWRDGYVSTLRAGLTAADTVLLQARDVDGATWTTFGTLTSNNTPTMDLASTVTVGGSETITTASTTDTFTNKTIDANGTGNSISNIDVADLADGTDGELITWSATAAPTTVPVGTATHVLTSNGAGAAPTFQAAPSAPSLNKTITVEDPTASEDITIWYTPVAITVTAVEGVILGATNVALSVMHNTDRNATGNNVFAAARTVSSTTTGDNLTLAGDTTIPAASFVWLETSSLSGTPTEVSITIQYTED